MNCLRRGEMMTKSEGGGESKEDAVHVQSSETLEVEDKYNKSI